MPLHYYSPVGLVLRFHCSSIIEKVVAICTKGYHENFSKQHSGATFRRNTCFKMTLADFIIIGWRSFWTLPCTVANTGTISHASISENVYSIVMYMCTNFGTFITKWTIGLVCLTMPLHSIDFPTLVFSEQAPEFSWIVNPYRKRSKFAPL